jgi:ribosome-binding protein aMBF1 (putative translation factor)
MGLQERIAEAIEESGLSLYRVAKDVGMSYPLLYRFYHLDTDAKLTTADKLVEYLGLELVNKPKRKGARRRSRKSTPKL